MWNWRGIRGGSNAQGDSPIIRRSFLDVVQGSRRQSDSRGTPPGSAAHMARSGSSLGGGGAAQFTDRSRSTSSLSSNRQNFAAAVGEGMKRRGEARERRSRTPAYEDSSRQSSKLFSPRASAVVSSGQPQDFRRSMVSFADKDSAHSTPRQHVQMEQRYTEQDLQNELVRSASSLGQDEGSKFKKQFAFVEGPTFSGTILFLLLLNGLALALETDNPHWSWWRLVNCFFLSVFTMELVLRFLYKGAEGMFGGTGSMRLWMYYDLVCVVLGILDFLVTCLFSDPLQALPSAPGGTLGEEGSLSFAARRLYMAPEPTSGRLARRGLSFTRLLRLVRIIRLHGPLYSYVKLLLSMMHTYMWILTIMFILCFAMAIVLTSLMSHGLLMLEETEEMADEVAEYFADIPNSLFTLFQLTTAEDWSKIQNAVIDAAPLLRGFFIFFIVFMSWTMLSLLSAVASETMISAASNKKELDTTQEVERSGSFSNILCAEFLKADTDGNRVLDKEEFNHLMSQPQMKQLMKAHGIQIQDSELLRVWDTFDIDESGELTIDEIVTGFSYMQENLAMKHVANVCYSLKHFGVKMESNTDIIQTSIDELVHRQTSTADVVLGRLQWQHGRWKNFVDGDGPDELDAEESSQTCSRSTSNLGTLFDPDRLSGLGQSGVRGISHTLSKAGKVVNRMRKAPFQSKQQEGQ